MIAPGVNSPIEIYCFDSKAPLYQTFTQSFVVQCEKALRVNYVNPDCLESAAQVDPAAAEHRCGADQGCASRRTRHHALTPGAGAAGLPAVTGAQRHHFT